MTGSLSNSDSSFFHVRLRRKGFGSVYALDLDGDVFAQRIQEPYARGQAMGVGGAVVSASERDGVTVLCTDSESSLLVPGLRRAAERNQLSVPPGNAGAWHLLERSDLAFDVTTQVLHLEAKGNLGQDIGESEHRLHTAELSPMMEPEQEWLLATMVEAERSVTRDKRRPFKVWNYLFQPATIEHPGLTSGKIQAPQHDIDTLIQYGLLLVHEREKGHAQVSVSRDGKQHYEGVSAGEKAASAGVEAYVARFLDSDEFRKRHSKAFDLWSGASAKLWQAENLPQFTEIGHACREAMQEFGESLLSLYPVECDAPKDKPIKRVSAVIQSARAQTASKTVCKLLEALVPLWHETNNCVQRQEHGGTSDADIHWEDARRVVFVTGVTMFETDRFLSTLLSAE